MRIIEAGGYFSTSGNDPSILLRLKEEYDSAEPTASSIAVSNLVRLSLLLSSKSAALMEKARMTIQSFTSRLEKMPSALPQLAFSAYLYEAYPSSKKVRIRNCGACQTEQIRCTRLSFAVRWKTVGLLSSSGLCTRITCHPRQ